ITLEAIRWMVDTGIAYVHLEADGRLLASSSAMGVDYPALRRAQARAAGTELGRLITVCLLDQKLEGQARAARRLGNETAAAEILMLRTQLRNASNAEQCRSLEAAAANLYWGEAWATVPVRFVRRDRRSIPGHWQVFQGRQSALATATSARR